ncbi:MAG: hypothetical protein CMB67_05130 [Euryarchaeota archaeon]|nr:hypothetical protein [Euryarchaeota archaeon]|tara:strand:- start:53 stop:547 length:495 start_codon:yes stop_codon:yes gene_type:complete
MKKSKARLAALFFIAVYLLSVVAIQIAAPDQIIDPSDFPEKCPEDSLNCSIVSPYSHRSGGLMELRFNSNLETVMLEVNEWIDSNPRTEIIGEWTNQTHSVFKSLMFRFPDDFVVSGFCDNNQTVIYVYSQSRLGISDIGVNKDRVTSFAMHMKEVEMPTSECF